MVARIIYEVGKISRAAGGYCGRAVTVAGVATQNTSTRTTDCGGGATIMDAVPLGYKVLRQCKPAAHPSAINKPEVNTGFQGWGSYRLEY